MVRRCPICSGVSRTISTRRRRSFSTTSAARVSSVPVVPAAISDIDLIEHGATIMPSVLNDPEAIEAWLRKLEPFFVTAYPVERHAAALAPLPEALRARGVPALHEIDFEPTNLAELKIEPRRPLRSAPTPSDAARSHPYPRR